jgi:nitrous oxide reductase
MTEKDKKPAAPDRRQLLRSLGTGALGTAAVAAGGAAVVITPAEAATSVSERKKARYKETEHVKAYYRTNRY